MRTVTALYDSRADAEAAQRQLEGLGVLDANIHDQSSAGFSGDSQSPHQSQGFWASLKEMFLPDEDRHTYEEGVRRGGYLLTARVDDGQADRVHDLLESTNAVNVDERASQWRQEGWSGPATGTGMTGSAASMAGTSTAASAAAGTAGRTVAEERIPIVEEELRVGKREVTRGGVRVRSYVVEQPVHESIGLREEHVSVERRAVDQSLAAGSSGALAGDAFQERNIELTETAEEAVVAKEARVREELVVRKDVEERVQNIDDTVRHTEVEVDDQSRRLAASDEFGQEGFGRDGGSSGDLGDDTSHDGKPNRF